MQNQVDGHRNGAQLPNTLHKDVAELDITPSTNGSEIPGDIATEDTSVTEEEAENETRTLALDMQGRCRLLHDELEQFQAYLHKHNRDNSVELRLFKADVQSEMKLIDKVI